MPGTDEVAQSAALAQEAAAEGLPQPQLGGFERVFCLFCLFAFSRGAGGGGGGFFGGERGRRGILCFFLGVLRII